MNTKKRKKGKRAINNNTSYFSELERTEFEMYF